MNYSRPASHAGPNGSGWYEAIPGKLKKIIDQYFTDTLITSSSVSLNTPLSAIISPHAGMVYSGATAAAAFVQLRQYLYGPKSCGGDVRRVLVLGPSHTKAIPGIEISAASAYETPFGPLGVDTTVTKELMAAFHAAGISANWADRGTDEAEHSLEMQMPFLSHVLHYNLDGSPSDKAETIKIVPIIVGSSGRDTEEVICRILQPYLKDRRNVFIFSSDFCHWGSRFHYTYHYEKVMYPDIGDAIIAMDHRGAELLEARDLEGWYKYLERTGNTICGCHPIGVGFHWWASKESGAHVRLVSYSQSNKCQSTRDSSVSYASFVISQQA